MYERLTEWRGKMMNHLNKDKLAKLLKEAEATHAVHERTLGKPDPDWSAWYADYIIEKLNYSHR
ncbi:MAG: hypothetical protein ACE5F4_01575 [Candidatus Paceibacteria bacterium]